MENKAQKRVNRLDILEGRVYKAVENICENEDVLIIRVNKKSLRELEKLYKRSSIDDVLAYTLICTTRWHND